MRRWYTRVLLFMLIPVWAMADTDNELRVTIADPFIELHSGSGSGYPIFYVIDRGESVVIIKRKTDWFKIKASNGREGWASKQQMQKTLTPAGEEIEFTELTKAEFVERRWELGVTSGEFKQAPILSLYGGYAFTQNLSAEFSLSQVIGNVSSSTLYKLNLLMQPFAEWDYSPFFSLGLANIQVKPNATLINPDDRSNQVSQVGIGFKKHISRRFVLRFEWNDYIIFSASNDQDQNEDISEWKLGFAIFF